jgi:hypothetical protein
MNAGNFEAFLARIYVDPDARARFLTDPYGEAQKAGLTEEECEALGNIDRVGLEFAAQSFARKRTRQEPHHGKGSWLKHWSQVIRSKSRVRSVVGTLQIADIDPDLSTADAAIRDLFSPQRRK